MMENKVTIYKGEVMHDLKALFDNAGDYFEDEYELVKQYIEQLEQALDKACEVIDDITKDNATEFCPATQFDWLPSNCNEHTCENGTKEYWKEWTLQNRK